VVLGGDFRQILPVITKERREHNAIFEQTCVISVLPDDTIQK
jgi:hypothetical protein